MSYLISSFLWKKKCKIKSVSPKTDITQISFMHDSTRQETLGCCYRLPCEKLDILASIFHCCQQFVKAICTIRSTKYVTEYQILVWLILKKNSTLFKWCFTNVYNVWKMFRVFTENYNKNTTLRCMVLEVKKKKKKKK